MTRCLTSGGCHVFRETNPKKNLIAHYDTLLGIYWVINVTFCIRVYHNAQIFSVLRNLRGFETLIKTSINMSSHR